MHIKIEEAEENNNNKNTIAVLKNPLAIFQMSDEYAQQY